MTPAYGVVMTGDTPADWRDAVGVADGCGFWGLGVGDSQSIYPDVHVRCTVASLATTTLRVGPWVTNPVTRHPVVTAGAIASVDEVSGGRAFLGIGSGDSAVRNLGLAPGTTAHLEAYVRAVQELLRTGETTWEGRQTRLRIDQRPVPVIMAAAGPRTLEMAGRVADGVVVVSGLDPASMDRAREAVAHGCRAAGRSLDDIDVWWLVLTNIAEDDDLALDEIKNSLATYAHLSVRSADVVASLPEGVRDAVLEVQRRYRPIEHATYGPTHNAGLTDELGVTDFLAERFALVGSPSTVTTRLRELHDRGAERIWLSLRVPDKQRILRLWRDEVLPGLPHAASATPPPSACPGTGAST